MSSTNNTDQSGPGSLLSIAAVLIPGAVLSLTSATIVGIAVPELAAQFPREADNVQWAATIALLAAGIAIPVSGWSTLRFGVRRTWLMALALFVVSSVAVALAPSLASLIGFRALQGLGAGALEPVMLTALARAAGQARMGRVMGFAGASMSLGPLIGPLAGAALIESIGWRWIFVCIAATGALILLASAVTLPRDGDGTATLDLTGLVLLSGTSMLLLGGLSKAATSHGIDAATWSLLGGALLALMGLQWWLRRRGSRAIIDPHTLTSAGFTPGVIVMFLVGAAIYPLLFGLPQFYRTVLELTPLQSGLMIAPYAVGTLLAMPITGRLSDRIGARPLIVLGAALVAASAAAFTLLGAAGALGVYALLSLVLGVGTGSVGGPTVGATYRVLAPELIPSGSTILFVVNQIGGALGIAVFAGVMQMLGSTTEWSSAAGTIPMVLPGVAAVAIALLASRLDRRRPERAAN